MISFSVSAASLRQALRRVPISEQQEGASRILRTHETPLTYHRVFSSLWPSWKSEAQLKTLFLNKLSAVSKGVQELNDLSSDAGVILHPVFAALRAFVWRLYGIMAQCKRHRCFTFRAINSDTANVGQISNDKCFLCHHSSFYVNASLGAGVSFPCQLVRVCSSCLPVSFLYVHLGIGTYETAQRKHRFL